MSNVLVQSQIASCIVQLSQNKVPDAPFHYVQLSQGLVAKIDSEDSPLVQGFKWHFDSYYAASTLYIPGQRSPKITRMHRLIMGAKKGQHVDHINRDKLDNRKINLRFCSHKENSRNSNSRGGTSKYKGVRLSKNKKKWQAQIRVEGKSIYLGVHTNEVDAAKAYNDAALEHFGRFAFFNKVGK